MHFSSTGERLRFVSMTADPLQGKREACLAAGMDGCVDDRVTQPMRVDAPVAAPLRVSARKKPTRELK